MRTLILHHHLFKNAGTSIDLALARAFGARWRSVEAGGGELTAEDLLRLAEADPALAAVSSHTFRPPFGVSGRLRLLPVVLLRHPLDRARSAYEFERQQRADTFGARLAKETDFRGYIETLLGQRGNRSMRNFQANKLSVLPRNNLDEASELSSLLAIASQLPFLGLVETYELSMGIFAGLISREFEPVSFEVVRANQTRARHDSTLEERLAAARAALGPEVAARFDEANRTDLQLYRLVRQQHDRLIEAAG
jgi:hypothetical protein